MPTFFSAAHITDCSTRERCVWLGQARRGFPQQRREPSVFTSFSKVISFVPSSHIVLEKKRRRNDRTWLLFSATEILTPKQYWQLLQLHVTRISIRGTAEQLTCLFVHWQLKCEVYQTQSRLLFGAHAHQCTCQVILILKSAFALLELNHLCSMALIAFAYNIYYI